MDQRDIGKFIASCRKNKEMTQSELAEKLGVSINAVSKWERGVNLPDYSNLQELCSVLGISLNEFFAGRHLEECEIEKQSEENLLSVVKQSEKNRRRNKVIVIAVLLLLAAATVVCSRPLLIKNGFVMDDDLKYSQQYVVGEGNIVGDVDTDWFLEKSLDFEIGANKYGVAVFKDPKKAMRRLKKDYKKGLWQIRLECGMIPLTDFTYWFYKNNGWQVGGSEEASRQASFVTDFMNIYENSFREPSD